MLRKREALSGGPSSRTERPSTDGGSSQRTGRKKQRETTEKPGRAHHMFGDRMAGNGVEISSELPHRDRTVFMLAGRAEEPAGGSQSVRSSGEAGNDRGAKGRRKVEA